MTWRYDPDKGEPVKCDCSTGSKCDHAYCHHGTDDKESVYSWLYLMRARMFDPSGIVKFHGELFDGRRINTLLNGGCWRFADSVCGLTGWHAVTIGRAGGRRPFHVAVRTPRGKILDAEGLWPQEAFIRNWEHEHTAIRADGGIDPIASNWHSCGWGDGSDGSWALSEYPTVISIGLNVTATSPKPSFNVDAMARQAVIFVDGNPSIGTTVSTM